MTDDDTVYVLRLGMIEVACRATGWSEDDPDLRVLRGDEEVVLREVPTFRHADADPELVEEYAALYRRDGVLALPPVWVWAGFGGEESPYLVTGANRQTAAYVAGLERIFAWEVPEN